LYVTVRRAKSDIDRHGLHLGDGVRFDCAARVFEHGAGDGNRTRTVSLGTRYEPAIRAPGADV